jgi:hypothetical protein
MHSLVLLLALLTQTPTKVALVDSSSSGTNIAATALLGGTTSAPILMDGNGESYNTLTLIVDVNAIGTSTAVAVTCYHASTSALLTSAPKQAQKCDGAAAATCAVDVRTYTLTTAGITSLWYLPYRWVKCKLTDSGSGTVTLTAQKSRQ